MSKVVTRTAALLGTSIACAATVGAMTIPGEPVPTANRLLDPTYVAQQACGPIASKKTEFFNPGFHIAAAQAATASATADDRPRALRQSGHAHRSRDHPRAGGAALLRPGSAVRLRVQPWRGGARVPQGAGDRSHLRHVLLGRGLGAGAEHQLPDAARWRGAGLRGDRPGHGAEGGRQRARAGADRRPERALCRRSRAPTARRWMPPMPTPWRTWRRGSRTTTRRSCCSRTR